MATYLGQEDEENFWSWYQGHLDTIGSAILPTTSPTIETMPGVVDIEGAQKPKPQIPWKMIGIGFAAYWFLIRKK